MKKGRNNKLARKRGRHNKRRRDIRAKSLYLRQKKAYLERQKRIMEEEGTQHGDPIEVAGKESVA